MKRIYVRRQGEESGHVFKSHYSVLEDTVSSMPFTYVILGIISKDEYLENGQLMTDRFNLYISETEIDGRKKLAKSMKYFTWQRVLEPSISKRIYL